MDDLEITYAAGDVLTHLRFLPGFERENVPLADTGLLLDISEDEDGTLHILVVKA